MSNVDVVRRLYELFDARDFEEFKCLCDSDLEWIQNEGFPNGGHHRGADEVVENVFRSLGKHWERWSFGVEEILDAGDGVIVLGEYSGRHKATGKSFRAAAAHVYNLRNGLIHRFRQYTDTAVIRDATT